jgi:hypothetical protein
VAGADVVRRVWFVAVALVILAAGLGVRAVATGAFAKYAGVALYASLIYALAVVLLPRLAPATVAVCAVAFCWLVEFAQLTPYPADLSARSGLARLVLGSTFNAPDLFWYVVGAALVGAADVALRRARAGRTPPGTGPDASAGRLRRPPGR